MRISITNSLLLAQKPIEFTEAKYDEPAVDQWARTIPALEWHLTDAAKMVKGRHEFYFVVLFEGNSETFIDLAQSRSPTKFTLNVVCGPSST